MRLSQSENETSFDGSRMTDGQNHSSETDQKGDVDFGGGKDVIPISTLHGESSTHSYFERSPKFCQGEMANTISSEIKIL